MIPGAPAADAPVRGPTAGENGAWLLGYLGGTFTLMGFADAVGPFGVAALARERIPCKVVQIGGNPVAGATVLEDVEGLAVQRYEARPGTVYLLRPDQHVCARWREFDLPSVRAAIARATCNV
jgi:3-(3-hydroxy-phenyl)propionate hydroxylase